MLKLIQYCWFRRGRYISTKGSKLSTSVASKEPTSGNVSVHQNKQSEQSSKTKTDIVSLMSLVDAMFCVQGYDETQSQDPDNNTHDDNDHTGDHVLDADVVEHAVKNHKSGQKQ